MLHSPFSNKSMMKEILAMTIPSFYSSYECLKQYFKIYVIAISWIEGVKFEGDSAPIPSMMTDHVIYLIGTNPSPLLFFQFTPPDDDQEV